MRERKKGVREQENNKNYQIYIMLSQTKTYAARLIRLYTREPYAHASIALDENLDEMYSFARVKPNNPFITGFVKENINAGVYGKYMETACSVYCLKVTRQQYENVKREIEIFKQNKERYSYSYLGIIGVMVNIPVTRENRYFCSQFVAHLLHKSGIFIFNKDSALVRPVDIRLCPNLKQIYKGKLVDYRSSISNSYQHQVI